MKFQSEAIPGTEIQKGGKTYLYFGGTAYLGMQRDPAFLELMSDGIRRLGTHWGASRVGNVRLPVFNSVEQALAASIGSPAVLTLSSGFLAARLVSEYFLRRHPSCFFSPNCHEALLPPGSARHPDWSSLALAVESEKGTKRSLLPVVFTDSMGGAERPGPVWEQIKTVPRECILVVDDSHGIGVSGPGGSGSWKPLEAMGFKEVVLCASLGKAMGITAGMVAGSDRRLDELEKTPFFSGASPAPPAGLEALLRALETGMYRQKWQQLNARAGFLQDRIHPLGFLSVQRGYPVVGFKNRQLAAHLRAHRILITDFQYPAEGDTASQSRIVVTATHTERQLQYLADVLIKFRDS